MSEEWQSEIRRWPCADQAVMGTADLVSFFSDVAAAPAFWTAFFVASSSLICFSSFSFTVPVVPVPLFGTLNVMLRCTLPPMVPVSGVGTFTIGPLTDKPRWNVVGNTRPSGCWKGHAARVHAAPKRHCWLKWGLVGREGCEYVQLGRVQEAPKRQGMAPEGVLE